MRARWASHVVWMGDQKSLRVKYTTIFKELEVDGNTIQN